MQVRRVQLLYTLKTAKGYVNAGVYDVDSPTGIPEAVLEEVNGNRNTVRVLSTIQAPIKKRTKPVEAPDDEVTTTIDDGEDLVKTEEEKSKKRVTRKKK